MKISDQARALAQDLLGFIDVSPSPWHAVHTVEHKLLNQGFIRLEESQRWQLAAGKR